MISREEGLLYARLSTYKKRLDRARKIISDSLRISKKPYVSFSTGKDSTCLLHLVREQRQEVPAVFYDGGCNLPESEDMLNITENLKTWEVESVKGRIRKYGFDKQHSSNVFEKANRELFDKHGYDMTLIGLRSEESSGRTWLAKQYGNTHKGKCYPVLQFREHDIWAYIHTNNIEYNKAYDKGLDRIGYAAGTCLAAIGRYVYLKKHHPELYNRLASEFPEIRNYV